MSLPGRPLILASTSRYRAELLRRLGLPFEPQPPGTDEAPRPGESPEALARRLAQSKAEAVAARSPGRWVLGSDQVPSLAGRVLDKPGTRARAIQQLTAFSGQPVRFDTAVALAGAGATRVLVDVTTVRFRVLTAAEIARYVDAEPAYDCAGAFKAEGLGITLFEAIESSDPTGLIGLPLVLVRRLLAEAGLVLP